MGDFALELTRTNFGDFIDMTALSNDLKTDEGLRTAVLVSLFTDQRITSEDDQTFDGDKRGWWGDMISTISGDQIGSKLWLLAREKATNETRVRAEEYSKAALQWMIDDNIASKIDASAEYTNEKFLAISISITRPNGQEINYNFDYAWKVEGTR